MESVKINAQERRIRESLVGNVVFLQQCRVATLKPECSPPGTEPLSGWRGVGASVPLVGEHLWVSGDSRWVRVAKELEMLLKV